MTVKDLTADAVAEWIAATTHQAWAIAEERIWAQADKAEAVRRTDKNSARRLYLRSLLGEGTSRTSQYELGLRRNFLYAPQELWNEIDAVEDPLTLSAAAQLWIKARKKAKKEGIPIVVALQHVVVHYRRTSRVLKTKDGRMYRRTFRNRSKDTVEPPNNNAAEPPNRNWPTCLRQAVIAAMTAVAEDLPDIDREELRRWLDGELRVITSHFIRRVRQVRNRLVGASSTSVITRRQVVAACATLHLDPPKVGAPPDMLSARRMKRHLAREYHPDAGARPEMAGLYQAVIEAYETLEQYAREVAETEKKKEGDRDVEAR